MHELHLLKQIVKAVETSLGESGDAKLSAVRLKVSAFSHLLTHDQATLQTTFQLAARGTKVEGATLEIIPVPGEAWCPQCKRDVSVTQTQEVCPACGGSVVPGPAVPEVMLHELVIVE